MNYSNYTPIDYSRLYSNQAGAVTVNGRPMHIPIEEIIRYQSQALPELNEIAMAREAEQRQMELEDERNRIAQRQANISMGIESAGLLGRAAMTEPGRRVALSGWNVARNLFSPQWTAPKLGYGGTESIVQGLGQGAGQVIKPVVGEVAQGFGEYASPVALPNAGYTANMMEATTAVEPVKQLATRSALGTTKAFLSPAGWGSAAGNVAQFGMERFAPGAKHRYTTMAGTGAGALAGMKAGAALGTIIPGAGTLIGGLVGAAFGGLSASTKKCILITVCHGENSPEVNLAREYRDKYFSKEILRGYYYFAEPIVDLMEQYPEIKEYYKTHLVQPLLNYGRWKLGYTREHPSLLDCAITRNYINLWHDIGATIGKFTRSNGEVI